VDYTKIEEFWKNVSPQDNIPLVGDDQEYAVGELNKICDELKNETSVDKQKEILLKKIMKNPELINILRLFIYKPKTRVELDLSYILKNTKTIAGTSICECDEGQYNHHHLDSIYKIIKNCGNQEIKNILTEYFLDKNLLQFLITYAKSNEADQEKIMDMMIESDSRQSRAKRRGHGAETAVAKIIKKLKGNLRPKDKLDNPMGGDIRLERASFKITDRKNGETNKQFDDRTLSYDLVILNSNDEAELVIVGTIHTSNPGQFGKDKIKTAQVYKKTIDDYNSNNNKDVKLIALVDGTGFSMSKNNLKVTIDNVDDIIQINTIYKIGLLLHKKGLCMIKAINLDCEFYNKEQKEKIRELYGSENIEFLDGNSNINSFGEGIEAGKATLYI
jgi:hypothetical protein